MKAHFYPITPKRILECFLYRNRRDYIGICWNLFNPGHDGYQLIEDFLDLVASRARRWWTPYWFLNLLHLFGNDRSIVRCRNRRLSGWHNILTNGIMIRDIKTKWGQLRIYGSFTEEIETKLEVLEKLIDLMLEPY